MLRVCQNESIFGKQDHVSDVCATICPRFAGPRCWFGDRAFLGGVRPETAMKLWTGGPWGRFLWPAGEERFSFSPVETVAYPWNFLSSKTDTNGYEKIIIPARWTETTWNSLEISGSSVVVSGHVTTHPSLGGIPNPDPGQVYVRQVLLVQMTTWFLSKWGSAKKEKHCGQIFFSLIPSQFHCS